MSESSPDPVRARRPHSGPMAGTFLEFDLSAEVERLRRERPWSHGHSARTLVKYDDLRVVLMALDPNARVLEHRADGRISIQALSGHIRVVASGRTFDLRAGGLLALDRGVPHHVESLEDSALLLTIAWPVQPPAGAPAR
jgi:quercetin dioxygenase-like cupin family protein